MDESERLAWVYCTSAKDHDKCLYYYVRRAASEHYRVEDHRRSIFTLA